MARESSLVGRCMCGAVKINATTNNPDVTACHCDMCRRWSAGPFMEVNCQNLMFDGDEHIGRVRSSEWAERGFCKECGSNLFYHIIDSNDYQVSAGLFDDQTIFRMSLQVFFDFKPDFYEFANRTQTMTSEEVFEAFSPPPN